MPRSRDQVRLAPVARGNASRAGVLLHAVHRARHRLRLGYGLDHLARGAMTLVALGSVLGVGIEWGALERGWFFPAAALVAAGAIAVFTYSYLRGPGLVAAAVEFDRLLERRGAFCHAVELEGRASLGPFEVLVLAGELRAAPGFDVRRVPVVVPRRLGAVAALVLVLVTVGFVPRRAAFRSDAPAAAAVAAPRASISAETLELLAADVAEVRELSGGRATEVARDVDEVVRRLERREISMSEGQDELALIERELEGVAIDGAATELRLRGEALGTSRLAESAGRALGEVDRKEAARALSELAERLEGESTRLSERELTELRQAVARALEEARAREANEEAAGGAKEGALEAEAERLNEKKKRLLDRQKAEQMSGQPNPETARELERTERQLERLGREKKQAREELSELDRELAEAMKELDAARPKEASKFLDRASESLERAAERRMTDDEKRALLEQVKKMKERLSEGGASGGEESAAERRMREFLERARAERSSGGGKPGQGQPGEPGQGAPGQGMPTPAPGSQSGSPGAADAEAMASSGRQPGSSHDENLLGDPTAMSGETGKDVSAAAQDSGSGASESETIRTAAEEGFRGASYEKLYRDYQTVREEVLDKEPIPPGRRRQVERYFELIRPR